MFKFSALLILLLFNLSHRSYCQLNDSIPKTQTQNTTLIQSAYFQAFSGGINAIYNNNQTKGAFDLAVQTCHYFLITGKRAKTDSLHNLYLKSGNPINELYKGFHFFILNRAAVNFDSIKAIAVDYITSLRPSPFTFRLQKEMFLTSQHNFSEVDLTPVISILVIGDGRAVPYVNREEQINVGASGHLYLSLSTKFKRIEFDPIGRKIDQGVIYFKPSFGIAYGSNMMMKSVQKTTRNLPILSSECRLGFQSDKRSIKDFSFLLGYTITDIIGPRLRAGVLLTSIN